MVDRLYGAGGRGGGKRFNPEYLGGDTTVSKHSTGVRQGNTYVSGGGPGRPGGSGQTLSGNLFDKAREGYVGTPTGYDPYQVAQGPEFQSMNYDPYTNAAVNQAQSGAANQMVGQAGQLSALPGGMSSSDRIKLFNDYNRQKILGQQGAEAKYGALASHNVEKTGMQNVGRDFAMQGANIGAANEASKYGADAGFRKAGNLYGSAMAERNLARQLEASGIIGAAQMKNPPKTLLEKILDIGLTDEIGDALGGIL